jgi:hypothetical protein
MLISYFTSPRNLSSQGTTKFIQHNVEETGARFGPIGPAMLNLSCDGRTTRITPPAALLQHPSDSGSGRKRDVFGTDVNRNAHFRGLIFSDFE